MKDNRRGRRSIQGREENNSTLKNTLYIAGTILLLGIIAFFVTIMIYNNSIDKIYSDLEDTQIGQVSENEENTMITEETSLSIGKTVEESQKETNQTNDTAVNKKEENKVADSKKTENKAVESKVESEPKKEENKANETSNEVKEENKEEIKELTFIKPVEGEILKEYAKDTLVYSETLKEWITHTGVDIRAEKTTVVKAAEDGTVTAIKNDPRYGTTVIISHTGGYETRYANLLTAEFVSVGEKVTKGQTVGTVGNTGAFEVLDDFHLHFELLKDNECQDPTLFLK